MSDIKWIKLSTDLFDNRKIKQIRKFPEGDAILGIWMQILCLAGNVNNGGLIYFSKDVPYTEEMLSTEFDRPINIVRLAISTFLHFEMIEVFNDIFLISNWEKYQSTTGLEEIREKHKLVQREFRARQKLLISDVTVTSPVTDSSISISSSSSSTKDNKKVFKKPTILNISEYCTERNNGVNAEKYYNHYESNGWMIGKNKMKDWKAAVRTWENNTEVKPISNTFDKLTKV